MRHMHNNCSRARLSTTKFDLHLGSVASVSLGMLSGLILIGVEVESFEITPKTKSLENTITRANMKCVMNSTQLYVWLLAFEFANEDTFMFIGLFDMASNGT